MSKVISYNLPGYGFADCFLFGKAVTLMDLLENYGLIEKMKNTCQLGPMKYVYPGAHHTRYEYVFTQLMLISNVVTSKGGTGRSIELSLSANLCEYENKVSGGELMQCLAILSNAGHMYDTFTSSKLLMCLLKESQTCKGKFYTVYKRNLPDSIQKSFDELLSENNYYKLHLFNMCHLIKGFSRTATNIELCTLCIHFLEQLINPKLIKNEATQRIFCLYKKIRKISYLSIDMVYTPASFGANLNRMIFSISSFVDDLFNEDSSMNLSIQQLEDIIHKQIYDSAKVILNSTRIEQENFQNYEQTTLAIKNIYDIRDLIIEKKSPYCSLRSYQSSKAFKQILPKSELLLSHQLSCKNSDNLLNFDHKITSAISTYRIAFGTQISQNLQRQTAAFALISNANICSDSQTIIAKAIEYTLYSDTQKIDLVKYAIMSLYKYGEFFFTCSSPIGINVNDCVLIGRGCKSIANQIRKNFTSHNVTSSDELHEILSCAEVLDNISYSGLVLCFVGGIKASKFAQTQKIDEIDGFLYFPTKATATPFAVLIEAKNYKGGENDAAKQLKDTLKFLNSELSSHVSKLKKCAFMELSL